MDNGLNKKAMAIERKIYHVLPHGDEGCWKAEDIGTNKIIFEGDVKEEVIQKIKEKARREEPSQVVVYGREGSILYESIYGEATESNNI